MEKADVNILLVDDEIEITKILAKRLGRRGYCCETANNGKAGLEKLVSFSANVVIMDIKMPVMDGIKALSCIVEQYPHCKVILLSGHADMQMAVNAMSKGAFAYLMKPVNFDELYFKIEDALRETELEHSESR